MPSTSIFSYSTAPQPIRPGKKYRNDEGSLPHNLMNDPRVIRGITTVVPPALTTTKGASAGTGKMRTDFSRTSNDKSKNQNQGSYIFESKKYCNDEFDMSTFLTEANQHPTTRPVDTQTDDFQYRPPTPEYIPRKTGIDTCTQIDDTNELFSFEDEVVPMLEIMMKKTLEQALFEVNAEEEMRALGECMLRYEEANLCENKWMKEKERETFNLVVKKEKEVEKAIEKENNALHTATKVAGLQAIRQLMGGIIEDLSADLYSTGDWTDPLEVRIGEEVSALVQRSAVLLESFAAAEEIALELLLTAQERYSEIAQYKRLPRTMEITIVFQNEVAMMVDDDSIFAEIEAVSDGNEEKSEVMELAVEPETFQNSIVPVDPELSIGPILVDESDTIASVERKVCDALRLKNIADKSIELYPFICAALKGVEFPLDSLLMNLNLPSTLNIIF
jgi:hypothetical protein